MYLTVVGLVQIFVCEKKMRNQNKAYLLTARPFKNVSFLTTSAKKYRCRFLILVDIFSIHISV